MATFGVCIRFAVQSWVLYDFRIAQFGFGAEFQSDRLPRQRVFALFYAYDGAAILRNETQQTADDYPCDCRYRDARHYYQPRYPADLLQYRRYQDCRRSNKVNTSAKELHLFTNLHCTHTTSNGVIVTINGAHNIITFILYRIC